MILRLLLLLCFSANVYAVGIHVALNHNPVNLNDSFDIIFSATDEPDGDPDFSPLESDFSILNQSQQSYSTWINGKSGSSRQWLITVMAKKAGSLIIPSIRFGNDVSETATVLVTTEANNSANNNEELFLKAEVSTESPYIQSQVLYKVRLYTRMTIAQAQLTEPELADALIERLGEDSHYSTQINGVDYTVTERNYALFPQKSGQLLIKPLSLTADIVTNGHSRLNSFFLFNSQSLQTKQVQSNAISLQVKPVPNSFANKSWLSAEHLDLKQQWSGDIQQMKVGEPLTRTLTLLAKGTTVGQLPELNKGVLIDALKAYPDQAVLKENKPSDGIIAFREEKTALIPAKAGQYRLPAVEIPWFNTKTQQMEIAKIPEQLLTASATTTAVAPTPVLNSEKPITSISSEPINSNTLWLILTVFFATAWLITLAYVLRQRLLTKTTVQVETADALNLKQCVQQLKTACQTDNKIAAKEALLVWGQLVFNASNLTALARHCDVRLRDEILVLNAVLYAKETQIWQGKKLLQAFNEHKARTKLKTLKHEALEPLHRL